jgi:hypothetical protein
MSLETCRLKSGCRVRRGSTLCDFSLFDGSAALLIVKTIGALL